MEVYTIKVITIMAMTGFFYICYPCQLKDSVKLLAPQNSPSKIFLKNPALLLNGTVTKKTTINV